ncbi:D-TA family PLP-dependent enzyme [uncultured Boseongicola sp.]|jgi:D-serine deaminase-like pyridoxal phosphate-dependent protein|uniref:D-TA family PLP-dependent enzyme n=1 Tax=uncultured Boseongicola sp. TaxID=1648499 RepID=UPI0026292EA3|nr:D-TA family PLP-dependent enzyme [uncultured Boseongicola sp.]
MGELAALKTAVIESFGTPCPVIDLDVVERNIARAQQLCDAAGVANRPHIKTHKSPILAKMQIAAGAQGITCQKLGEAEVMANAGITDIVIATNLLGAARSGRLAALQRRVALKVCADNPVSLSAYSEAAQRAERPLDVMIECDTGQKRAGVETPREALALAQIIRDNPWLNFAGLLFYPALDSWPQTQVFLDEMTAGLASLSLKHKIISTGGTPNFANIGKLKGATEHRAGTCIFNDRMMIEAKFATLGDCALQVFTSVVSRGGEERGILDAGSKTLTSDTGGLEGFGLIMEHPEARIHKFAEEHGFLDLSRCNNKPVVGDIVRVIPNHVCVAVNMVDQLVAVRGGEIAEVIPVAARGMLV